LRTVEVRLWKAGLPISILAAALIYVSRGRQDDVPSQILLGALSLTFIFAALRHMANVEGRRPFRMLPVSILFWLGTWLAEEILLHTGLPGGRYTYGTALLARIRIGTVPLIVPTLWTAFGWMASSIVAAGGRVPAASLDQVGGGRPYSARHRGVLRHGFQGGLVFVSIAFAVEWHFSRAAGFWTWQAIDSRFALDGVPIANFFLWFAVGYFAVGLGPIVHAPPIRYGDAALYYRRLPVYGLCALLVAGSVMNFAKGIVFGGWGCILWLALWAGSLARKR
jgi:hypothetical protein